jgi:hypothetical protein
MRMKIPEMLDSNLVRDAGYSKRGFTCFSQSLQVNSGTVPQLVCDHFQILSSVILPFDAAQSSCLERWKITHRNHTHRTRKVAYSS